ncbi:MAG: hypothetical protein MUF83_17625 [Acidimicrobiales bacterium]|jgi:hypothetical protein|nr:hypothetical protein [Acidimicrobiales bacterium]
MTVISPSSAQAARTYPSISLLLPVEGHGPWRERLRHLAATAERRLREEFGGGVDRDLLRSLHDTVGDVEIGVATRSVAVFVNASGSWVVPLDVEVRERVVVDDTFATRDLVHAESRAAGYWVLALSLDRPRLWQGTGERLVPVPWAVATPVEDRRDPRSRRGRDRSDVAETRRARRLRAVDVVLGEVLAEDDDPLVVVGAEPSLSHFLRITRQAGRVEGVVRRAPDADGAALARRVQPVVAEVLAERRVAALRELDRAISGDRAVWGPAEVWLTARRTNGALLLVEEDFEYPARLLLGGWLQPSHEPEAPGVIDDAVDEMIEIVLARRGRVVLVPAGSLAAHGRIALVARERR